MRLSGGPTLAELRAQMLAKVDAEAEATRQKFITPGAGQAMEYQATEVEAVAYMAAYDAVAGPPAGPWPWLAAEQAASPPGTTLLDVAQLVLSLRDQWVAMGSTIKALRRAAKVAIEAADTPAAIRAAAVVEWPTP